MTCRVMRLDDDRSLDAPAGGYPLPSPIVLCSFFANTFLTIRKAAIGLKSILHFLPAPIIKALSGFRKPSYFIQLDFFPEADVKITESLDTSGFLAV